MLRAVFASASSIISPDTDTPVKTSLERAIERATGQPIESLRNSTLTEQRRIVEEKTGHRLVFTRNFPFIGRGNVMRDQTVSHEEVEKLLAEAIR